MMKRKILAFTLACLSLLGTTTVHSEDLATTTVDAKGSIDLKSMSVWKVLQFYQQLSGADLIISSDIHRACSDVTLRLENASKAETVQALERALLQQTGVVVTSLGSNRVSATYDDKLKPDKELKIETSTLDLTAKEATQTEGIIDFQNMPLDAFLKFYQKLAQRKLVIDSEVYHGQSITLKLEKATQLEAEKAAERALLQQAGILVTPINDRQILVTRNDKLQIEKLAAKVEPTKN